MRILILVCFSVLMISCGEGQKQDNIVSESRTNAQNQTLIKAVMQQQQDDWNAGDIDGFMEGYWRSDSLSFVSTRGVSKGWEQTLENYHKSYPDRKTMGNLKFDVISLDSLSDSAYQMLGKYTLYREDDEPSGYFTLLWKNIRGKWVIVSDQTCG